MKKNEFFSACLDTCLVTRFGTMGTMLTRLEEKEQGAHHESAPSA
jgi:hypothetical protein